MLNLTTNNPLSQIKNFQREISDIFNTLPLTEYTFPRVNILQSSDDVKFIAELPGVKKEELNLSLIGNQLSLEIERKEPIFESEVKIYRSEISYGKFIRSFDLPYEINSEKVTAKLKNGILEVSLPRLEESKPKKISVILE